MTTVTAHRHVDHDAAADEYHTGSSKIGKIEQSKILPGLSGLRPTTDDTTRSQGREPGHDTERTRE